MPRIKGVGVASFNGFAELQTPRDLVRKLEHDLERLTKLPQDQYAAFDFFITADNMIDWIHPANRSARNTLRSSSTLLRIASHIANVAKHFDATAHHSVADIEKSRYVEPEYVDEDYFDEPLIVHLTPDEAKSMGQTTIELVQLAERVLEYWKANAP